MPIVIEHAGGWGCQCKAFRAAAPHKFLVDIISRASTVTVERHDFDPATGTTVWKAWSRPDEKYTVTHDPRAMGGWCKHTAACAADLAGGQLQGTFQAVKEMKEACHEQAKELRKTQRMLETAQRKVEQSKTSAGSTAL